MDKLIVNIKRDEQCIRGQFTEMLNVELNGISGYYDRMAFLKKLEIAFKAMEDIVSSRAEDLAKERISELERAVVDGALGFIRKSEDPQNQHRKLMFSTTEVMELTGIRTKNCMIGKFKDGTLPATQDTRSKQWTVKRADLAAYLGRDDF